MPALARIAAAVLLLAAAPAAAGLPAARDAAPPAAPPQRLEIVLSERCGAPAWRDAQAGRAVAALVEDVRARGAALRVVEPGDAATADYEPSRLIVETDGRGAVARAYCG